MCNHFVRETAVCLLKQLMAALRGEMKFQYQSLATQNLYCCASEADFTLYVGQVALIFLAALYSKLFVSHWNISLRGAGLLLDICSYGRISLQHIKFKAMFSIGLGGAQRCFFLVWERRA